MSSSYRTSVLALLLACAAGLQLGKQSLLSQELSDGLVSHWPLDEVQGTRTPDLVSGYDMDLVNLTAEDLVEGQIGMAFSFDNARQTILLRISEEGDLLPINQHPAFTISMWTNVEGVGQNDLRVFSEGSTEDSNPLFNIGTRNNGTTGQVDLYIRNGLSGWPTVGHIFSEQEPFDGTWSHIAFTQQEDGSRYLYVDGALDTLEIGPRPEEGDWSLNTTTIGGIRRASNTHWVTGLIDDVALWSRALSADEISAVISDGVPEVDTGPRDLAINSFTVEYPGVVNGQEAVLHWDASPDAALSINHGVGDVSGNTDFGVGSVSVALEGTRTFVLTATRDGESVTASAKASALDGVAGGWTLIDNFDTWEPGSINGLGQWRNPEGDAQIVEGPTSHALSFSAGAALNALELASKTIDEGVRTTLFFRVLVNSEAEAESLTLNLGFTDKPIRFVGDFDNDVGPFVQFSNHEVQGSKLFDLYAIDGVGETPVWLNNPDLDLDTHYNVWLDIDNRSVEDGDLFSIHIKEDGAGGDRVTVAEEWLSDRNPAGSTDLGAVFPELDVLFTVAFAGSESDGLVLFDDFYLSTTGSFNDSVPVPVQETAFMDEVDPPDPTGDAEIASVSLSDDGITLEYTGTLYASDAVTGPWTAVQGAASPYTSAVSGEARFYQVR